MTLPTQTPLFAFQTTCCLLTTYDVVKPKHSQEACSKLRCLAIGLDGLSQLFYHFQTMSTRSFVHWPFPIRDGGLVLISNTSCISPGPARQFVDGQDKRTTLAISCPSEGKSVRAAPAMDGAISESMCAVAHPRLRSRPRYQYWSMEMASCRLVLRMAELGAKTIHAD